MFSALQYRVVDGNAKIAGKLNLTWHSEEGRVMVPGWLLHNPEFHLASRGFLP
jgi:hypothetical protein